MSRYNPMIGVAILAISPGAATAQEAPAPQPSAPQDRVLPPIRYSLPPGEGTQQPAPTPSPAIITPPTIPTPRPAPTPTPRRTTRPTPTPTPVPTSSPSPVATPSPVPEAAPLPVPSPVSTTIAPSVEATPVPQPAPEGSPWPLIGAGLAALLGLGGVLLWRRKSRDEQVEAQTPAEAAPPPAPQPPAPKFIAPAPPVAPTPAPAPIEPTPQPPAFPPTPAGTITAFKNRPKATDAGYITAFSKPAEPAPVLGIEINPIRAGIADDAGFVEFQFAMVNASEVGVRDMLVSAWIISASPEQDAQIRASLNEPADPSNHNIYSLRPGEHRQHQATLGVPFEVLHVVEIGGRKFFAPMLLLDARYRSASGAPGRTSAAYMIGRPNPATGKLSPIYVDRGPIAVDGLAARAYPIPA